MEQPLSELNPNQGEEVSEWVSTPGASHVAAFRLVDRSKTEFGASSEIHVTFKGTGTKPGGSYVYSLSSHDAARQIFADMRASGHPGEVIHTELIAPRVPYKRVS